MKTLAFAAMVMFGAAASAQEPVYTPKDKGVTNPVVIAEKKPSYTKAAREKKIQGTVELEGVINKEGTLTDITVVRSLDKEYGLDENAVDAVKAWKFKPGMKDGKPVLVKVTIEMTFTLRDKK